MAAYKRFKAGPDEAPKGSAPQPGVAAESPRKGIHKRKKKRKAK